jgi:Chaperone of endosialidase
MKTSIPPVLITFALVCFAISPMAQAVVPPPDGGYPNFTTAEGTKALQSLTTGAANTAVGWFSLFSNTDGSFSTATGAGSLLFNNGDENTAFGAATLLFNSDGLGNTAIGAGALLNNTSDFNTAVGLNALSSNTTGSSNTAIGDGALFRNSTGNFNTATGDGALASNTTGSQNTATGRNTLANETTGVNNTAVGGGALGASTTGNSNTALGVNAGSNVTTASNVICIGSGVGGANVTTSCFIGNIRGIATVNNDAVPVLIDSAGQLGMVSSSRRFKKEIQPMDKASEPILALKPVTFHYKSDKTNRPEFGLIAEEVAEVNPDLVVRDEKGEIYTVRYEAVNAMLLNEFLKEHRKNEEQEATIERQQKQIDALTEGLQKVNTQLEASKPAPQVVSNNQ